MPNIVFLFHTGSDRKINERTIESGNKDEGICKWIPVFRDIDNNIKEGHARKHVITEGKYIVDEFDKVKQGKIGFWAEWEARSHYLKNSHFKSNLTSNNIPKYYHYPIVPNSRPPRSKALYMNTDPCVFEGLFLYSNCRQKKALKCLNPGDLIIFCSSFASEDSALRKNETKNPDTLIIDTVYVVNDAIKNFMNNFDVVDNKIIFNNQNANFNISLPVWYKFLTIDHLNKRLNHTLYIGASFKEPLMGMYSFFPCEEVINEATYVGLSRVAVKFSDPIFKENGIFIKDGSGRSPIIKEVQEEVILDVWANLKKRVLHQHKYLGVYAKI